MALRDGLRAVVLVDIDLINCFGMFGSRATLDAVGEHLPELELWLRGGAQLSRITFGCPAGTG